MKNKTNPMWFLSLRNSKRISKKAQLQIPGAIVDFYAIITFVLVMLVFLLLFMIRGCNAKNVVSAEIQSSVADVDSNLVLLNYLRTPVVVDGTEMTMADLIVLYKSDLKFAAELRANPFSSSCYVLCIDGTKFEFNDCSFYDTKCIGLKQTTPYPEWNTITVQLDLDPAGLDIG